MFANVKTRMIEMTKKEANAIGKTTTPEFQEFATLKSVYPTFMIKIVTPKTNPIHKGLTYKFMEDYILKSDSENKEELLDNFKTLTKNDGGYKNANAFEVREWFLKEFPEYKKAKEDHRKEIDKILGKVA